jgi:hypothetical protein
MQMPLRHILAVAVGTVISVAGLGCKLGPVDYGKFERRTIEANLAAIDSASSIYATLLAAGDIDAAAAQAQAFLLTQPGVDTVGIAGDSTVWALFTSGLLAGTGDIRRDTTGSGAAGPEREPIVRVMGGGEVGDFTHYVLPHNTELPGTQKSADALRGIFQRKLGWENDEMYKAGEVDLGLALGLIAPGTSLMFWSGHGTLVDDPAVETWVCGLVLGKAYSRESMAKAVVTQYLGYFNPGPAQAQQVAVVQFAGDHNYHMVVLPTFVRANGDFDKNETLAINQTKTIVYLSCCYSYAEVSGPGSLVQAFRDVGADMVCGYSWAVGDAWACEADTTFLSAMADTCFSIQALNRMSSRTDPTPHRGGNASWFCTGDSMVLLRAVCQVKRDNELLRPGYVQATRSISGSGISAVLYPEQSSDPAANVMISFPGDQPGEFNCTSDENATIYWTDAGTGYTYTVMKNYVGVNGTISVDRCRSDAITGHFSGKLGWWDFGKDPEKEPPSDTITLDAGVFKFTGKVGSGKFSPQQFAAGTPPTVR